MNLHRDLERSLLISAEIGNLRKKIPTEVQRQLNVQDVKVRTYFKRAFVRWTFNSIRRGKNPFTDKISANEFVSERDVHYLFEKTQKLTMYLNVKLDWSWLDVYFEKALLIQGRGSDRDLSVFMSGSSVIFNYLGMSQTISRKQYENAKRLYASDPAVMDASIMILLSRYEACGTTNNHSSTPPQIVAYTGAKTELFGSPFNTCTKQYCSPFHDIEKDFGSLGSFFDFEIQTGIYMMNPPYDEEFMQEAMLKVLGSLKSRKEITIIVVLPVWDAKSQETHKGKVFTTKKFQALETAEKSGFVRSQTMLTYNKHKFYDYYHGKLFSVADAHLLVLSNTRYNLTAQQIADEWVTVSCTD